MPRYYIEDDGDVENGEKTSTIELSSSSCMARVSQLERLLLTQQEKGRTASARYASAFSNKLQEHLKSFSPKSASSFSRWDRSTASSYTGYTGSPKSETQAGEGSFLQKPSAEEPGMLFPPTPILPRMDRINTDMKGDVSFCPASPSPPIAIDTFTQKPSLKQPIPSPPGSISSLSPGTSEELKEETQELVEETKESSSVDSNLELTSAVSSLFLSRFEHDLSLHSDLSSDARAFEVSLASPLRSLTKRTVVEKITVSTRKTATRVEVEATAAFFTRLLTGKEVNGFGEQKLKLEEKAAPYVFQLIVHHYLGLLERDSELVDIIAQVLTAVAASLSPFGSIVLGSLFDASSFLSLEPSKCNAFIGKLVESSEGEQRSYLLSREKSFVRLYFSLFSASLRFHGGVPFGGLRRVWNLLAHLLNDPPLPIATPVLLEGLLHICFSLLHKHYGRQAEKAVSLAEGEVLPSLQKQLQCSERVRIAGQGMLISILRSRIDSSLLQCGN